MKSNERPQDKSNRDSKPLRVALGISRVIANLSERREASIEQERALRAQGMYERTDRAIDAATGPNETAMQIIKHTQEVLQQTSPSTGIHTKWANASNRKHLRDSWISQLYVGSSPYRLAGQVEVESLPILLMEREEVVVKNVSIVASQDSQGHVSTAIHVNDDLKEAPYDRLSISEPIKFYDGIRIDIDPKGDVSFKRDSNKQSLGDVTMTETNIETFLDGIDTAVQNTIQQ